jgi:hypothetical protein
MVAADLATAPDPELLAKPADIRRDLSPSSGRLAHAPDV